MAAIAVMLVTLLVGVTERAAAIVSGVEGANEETSETADAMETSVMAIECDNFISVL